MMRPPVHRLFEQQALRTPDAVAVECDGTSLTCAALYQRADVVAQHLRALGVRREPLVGVCVERGMDMIVGILAVLKAGGAYLPLDPANPVDRIAFMLRDAQVTAIVTQERLLPHLSAGAAASLCIDQIDRLTQPPMSAAVASEPTNLAYVIYTSGSTGAPKGVMIEHAALSSYIAAVVAQYGLTTSDRVLQFASLGFDVAVEEIFTALSVGAVLILRSNATPLDTSGFLATLADRGITKVELPTAYWHQLTAELAEMPQPLPPCLRLVLIGGEAALADRVLAWQAQFGETPALINTYGPTEATIVATTFTFTPDWREGQGAVPIGQPVARTYVRILDPDGREVPLGEAGELHIGGAHLARGYLSRPELTAERFIADPFVSDTKVQLYKTGDIIRQRADGNPEFLGRADFQVKIRGFRIEPGEIESRLMQHRAVREAVVLAREERPGDRRLIAYVVPQISTILDAAALRAHLRDTLPEHMLPAAIVTLTSLPLSPNGKIDRAALPAPDHRAGDVDRRRVVLRRSRIRWRQPQHLHRSRPGDPDGIDQQTWHPDRRIRQ
jgi:amino acid adenylation domain-containing protein